MAEQWYYRLMGEEFGPVSETALRELLAEGTIGSSDEVRRKGDSHWQKAGERERDAEPSTVADVVGDVADTADLDSLLAAPSLTSAERSGSGDAATSDLDAMLAASKPGRRKPASDEWYYRTGGERFGPFDFDSLFEHASSGRFARYDEILSPGADDWVEAQSIVGLFADEEMDLDSLLVNEQPREVSSAPRTARAGKQWYYRVLNQELGPVDFDGLFDQVMEGNLRRDDDIRESGQTEWQRADSMVGLFPDDDSDRSDASADPAVAAGQQAVAAPNQSGEEDDWYFKMDEQELGPVTFERLMQLAQAGRLQQTDPIRLTRLGSWMDAGSMVGLFPDENAQTADTATSDVATAVEDAESDAASAPAPDVDSDDGSELEPEPLPEPRPRRRAKARRKRGASVLRRSSRDDDDFAAALLSEPGDDPPPPAKGTAARSTPHEPAAVRPDSTAADVSNPAPASEPAPAAAAAASIAAGMAATHSNQKSTFTPPPKSSRKSSSGGGGFSLPAGLGDSLSDPKVLGAAGAVALLITLLFLPWGKMFSPPTEDLAAELQTIWSQVKPLYEDQAPDSEWAQVTAAVRMKLSEVSKEATSRGASPREPALHIVKTLASGSIPNVLTKKSETPEVEVDVVDNFFARLKEM